MNPKLVSLRDLSEAEIPLVLEYWFHSPEGFIESLGVDPAKMPAEEDMKTGLIKKCQDNQKLPDSKLNAVVILYERRPIGLHTLFPMREGESGIFHAHIWDQTMRRKGIAQISYPLACKEFMKRFNLQKILFKTPKQNTGAIRVKEKLGIRYIGEEIVDFSIIKSGTLAQVFEITKEELSEFK